MAVRTFTLVSRTTSNLSTGGTVTFRLGSNGIIVPSVNQISPSTAASGFTGSHLVGISSDGKHLVDIDPATIATIGSVTSVNGKTGTVVLTAANVGADASGTAAVSMVVHLADGNPHTQYALDTDLANYSLTTHKHAADAITSGTLDVARLPSTVARYDTAGTFTNTVTISKVLIPPQVTGATNPLTIRANTGGAFTEPIFYVGVQGSETSSGIAFRSNGATQLLGGAAVGQFNDIQLGGAGTAAFGLARGSAQSFNLGGPGNFTFDAGSSGTNFDVIHSAKSSTTAGRTASRTLYSWSNSTDATRSGQAEEYVGTYSGNVRIARRFAESLNPFHALSISATAPTDGALQASEVAFYTDSSALFAKLKNASGTVYTIPLAGSGGSGGATFSGPINYPVAFPTAFGVNARDYGATGNGTTDDTAAIQAALTAGAGGVVYLPAGEYVLNSSTLAIPAHTTLQGTYSGPQSHSGYRDGSPLPTVGGSRLLVKQSSTAAVSLTHNSTLDGVCFYYPDQVQLTAPPTAHPATVKMRGNNPTVRNCEFLNSYTAIDVNNTNGTGSGITQRPTIEGVTGQPLYRGIVMGTANDSVGGSYTGVLDCPRISDVHWNPWWSYPQAGTSIPADLFNWMQSNAIGFEIGDVDEFYFRDCFMFGYGTGLLLKSINRGSYGSFLGGGFDTCPRCVVSDATQYPGVSFSGTSFGQPSSTTFGCINVNGGVILVSGGRFFNQNPCVVVTNGTAALTGCNFGNAGTHVTQSGGSVNVVGGMAKGGLGTTGTVSSTGVMSY